MLIEFDKLYTKEKEKFPDTTLNETMEHGKWFLIGFYSAYGNEKSKQKDISFSQKHKITTSDLKFL